MQVKIISMAQMLVDKPIEYAAQLGLDMSVYSDLVAKLKSIRKKITPEIYGLISRYETNPDLRQILTNAIPKGGCHRAQFVVIISGSRGLEPNFTLAAASELFYWGDVGLDDIADENTIRQNATSLRTSVGDSLAVYASNVLYGIALRATVDECKHDPEKLAKVMAYYAMKLHVTSRGQAIDMLMTKKDINSVSFDDYISLIEETTGVDVASSMGIGAVIAGLDSLTTINLYNFGFILGTLAQIRDDVLDYCDITHNGEYIIGKLPFRDIETKKKRLPLLLTGNTELMSLPDKIYDTIEKEFITPRKTEAIKHLESADISLESKKLLLKILDFWSDIRLFQKIANPI